MTSRVSLARTGITSVVAIVALVVVGTSCASGGGAAATGGGATTSAAPTAARLAYGYMIPGARVAALLNVGASDSVPELQPRGSLPSSLTTAIQTEATAAKYTMSCTRRFGGPTNFVVIYHRQCSASAGAEADPVVIIGFTADGRQLGKVPWAGDRTITLLYPARRF